ncbi:uncharacterized protein LOC130754349 [Actinidia eriantha]|uniref:uncharacterized protein LOC130754349 n=1 Tax=Actinidia eriantha TaxID=165200 RepID=UPI00258C35A7|nr:uncharacterized protein LOC130754349 [Actinidia eriantha]XP_057464528.1 uncharacterized protein LOC130754349 [Actinidia eriantha]
MQKSVKKRTSTARTSDALKQNNQKQNCVTSTDRAASKAPVSNQQDRKAPSSNDSVRPNKVPNSATGSRKMNSVPKDTGKKILSSKTKTTLENKRPLRGHIHSDESVGKTAFSKDEKSVKCNVANDVCLNWDIVDCKNSMDVVSFTFTSPIKSSAPGSQSSGQVMEKNPRFCVDSCRVIGGDALSVLLERKLKELTCRVESSDSLQDSVSTLNVINTASKDHHNSFQLHLHKDKSNHPHDIHCASVDGLLLKAKQKWQGFEDMEGCSISSDNSEYGKELDFRYPSPISNLERFPSVGSYNSSDCQASSITIGCKQSLLSVFHEMEDRISARNCQPMELEIELSDSASSTSAACVGGTDASPTFSLIDFLRSPNWELDYITKILHNSDLIIENFVLGRVNKVITPNLFDELENPKAGYDENAEDYSKLERKVLFDCVSECLEARSGQLFGGSYESCSKWAALSRRNQCLAEELYKEILSWTSMGEGDLMVDELVDKDMSSWYGRWVDFGIEAFEEGADIEKEILTSLVDEVVADFLLI